MEEYIKHYLFNDEYFEGLQEAQWLAFFRLAVQDGRLLPFEINVSLNGGRIANNDMFKIEEQSVFVFETIVYKNSKEIDYINN